MTYPADMARLFRDVVASGIEHQRTLGEQQGSEGFLVRGRDAAALPPGVSCPYIDSPDSPEPFLIVDPAGPAPRPPHPDAEGNVDAEVQAAHRRRYESWQRHRRLYDELFAARTPSEQLELVVAVGLLEHTSSEGVKHERHVVAAPAEIVLDQGTQRLSVSTADAFRVEHNWLEGSLRSPLVEAVDERDQRLLLEALADDAETCNGAVETWRRARAVYGQDTEWELDGSPVVGTVALSVEPVVLLRKKDTSHLLALLTAMVDDLEAGGHVSGPLQMLVDMKATVADLPVLNDQPALPKPANDEQRSMLEEARRKPHSIVQGPPGTGKTHTIANLAAVLMAEGRRVLITAENDRALREVQGKLPLDMQPLLLPLLKQKADSGLARSVTSLIEQADKQRRGARRQDEAELSSKRDEMDLEARRTIAEIRKLDALEAQEHELNGRRMRLAGHMIALDGHRHDLEIADGYLTSQPADPEDARTLLELHPEVSSSDRDLAQLVLPTAVPDPATFAAQLQQTRQELARLPERTTFDFAKLDREVVERLENSLTRLATLPAAPYAAIDRSAGQYRALATRVREATPGLNHGVTATGADPVAARDYLAAYLDVPAHYVDEPAGLLELFRRAESAAAASVTDLQLAAASDPVTVYEQASRLLARFRTDPTDGLLDRYVTDVRHRSDSSLKHLAEHARELAEGTGLPPTLPVNVAANAPAVHQLLEQAKALYEYLAQGGRMTRLIGSPAAVKNAAALIEHVTIAGSRIDTLAEVEAVRTWLQHRTTVQTARNWAEQSQLNPPAGDAGLTDWLTALARLPDEATDAEKQLTELLQRCHVPAETQAHRAQKLAAEVLTAASIRIVDGLAVLHDAAARLGSAEVRIEGVAVYNEAQAQAGHAHFRSVVERAEVAAELPAAWVLDPAQYDAGMPDQLVIACEVAAATADLPGSARPQRVSDTSIREILGRVHADRRRDELLREHDGFLSGINAALSICTPASPATDLLADAVRAEDATAYRHAHAAHINELERAERATRLRKATERIDPIHPRLVSSFLVDDDATRDVLARLDHYQRLLSYRREARALLDAYPDVRELHDYLAEVRTEHLRLEAALASARCWARAVERLAADRELAASLSSLQKAERAVPKTKTAKTYQRKLRAMRQATRDAAPAIPCWVMPIEKVAELLGYPSDPDDRFDVVIIDEASQAWFPSAFLYAIAEQVIVVGDHLQISPGKTSVREDEMKRLLRQHIPDHKFVDKLDGEFSLYDVAAEITSPSVMVDHFRCVPPIIELSNSLCYASGGQRLLPVRVTEPDALEPIQHVRVDGQRTSASGSNQAEIEAIVRQVVACVADPHYAKLSFGVVVVGPQPTSHIKTLHSALLSTLGPRQMAERQIEVGSPAQYQGAERNVMFLSLVDVPNAEGTIRLWPHELTGRNLRRIQELNVAVSRAQDQLWIFHSFGPENLKPSDARHVLLTPPARNDAATLAAQLEQCDSDFERHVAEALAAHPKVAKVRTQVEALGRRIDVVIESYDERRLAVECDGNAWHTADADVARDLYRQRTLEIAGGWRFQRFLASEWYADTQTIIDQTIEMLAATPQPTPQPTEQDQSRPQPARAIRPTSEAPSHLEQNNIPYPVKKRTDDNEASPTSEPSTKASGEHSEQLEPVTPRRSGNTSAAAPPAADRITPPPLNPKASDTAETSSTKVQTAIGSGDRRDRTVRPPSPVTSSQTTRPARPAPDTQISFGLLEPDGGWLSPQQAATQLGLPTEELLHDIDRGRLPAYRIAGKVLLRGADVASHASSLEPEPEASSSEHEVDNVELAAIYATAAVYEQWETSDPLPDPATVNHQQRARALRKIVAVEGPIVGRRLYLLYVKSAGGSRVGPSVRKLLNRTTYQMEQQGEFVADDPLGEDGQMNRTYRLPDQPPVSVRQLGDRTLYQVPPLELAARIRALRQPGDSHEQAHRRVLADYGLTKLTDKTRERLELCSLLIDDDHD